MGLAFFQPVNKSYGAFGPMIVGWLKGQEVLESIRASSVVMRSESSAVRGFTSFTALSLIIPLPFGIASDFFGFKSRGDSRSD